MVYIFLKSIEITVRLLAHPREHVVDFLVEAMVKLRSKGRGFRDESLQDAQWRTKAKHTVGLHMRACHRKRHIRGSRVRKYSFSGRVLACCGSRDSITV
jgi:hypothetical protein